MSIADYRDTFSNTKIFMILYAQVMNQNYTQMYEEIKFKILFVATLTIN